VRKTLSKLKTAAAGYFSSFSEPFCALENLYSNTQQGAQAFVDNGLPIFFLSRLRYPDWAIEQLKQNPYSYAQKSINTPDPKIWAKLSPGALPLAEHFKDIRRLKKAGIYVSVQVNPILPGIMEHKDIVKLIEKLGAAGADHVITKFVETAYPWVPAMVAAVGKGFGAVARERFASLFTQNIGGQRTVDEGYRMEGHRLYQAAATKANMTYALCYEYRYLRDENGGIINKVGISMGPDFMTSDQCHGRRVPLYSREDLSKPFQEVKQCPPAGCLTCADGRKTGLGRCGSPLYSAAKALTLADMKYSVKDKVGPKKTELTQIGGEE
jgi:DNA repair photolyase